MATYSVNGTTAAHQLDALGIRAATLRLQNQVEDVLELEIEQAAFDASAWAFNTPVVLYRDTTVIFRGVVTDCRSFASAQGEGLRVVVSGPWWQLSRIPYRQQWRVWDTTEEEFVDGYRTHVILGLNLAGTRLTSGQVISDALGQASTFCQVGTIDPATPVPLDEGTDMTLAEVIRRMLRWAPDSVVWFDYSVSPPRCHVRRAANLTALSVGFSDPVRGLQSVPRYDLKMNGVVVLFETTTTVDGEDRETITRETAGSPVEGDPLTLVLTVGISGGSSTSQSAKINTEQVPATLNTAYAWWKARVPAIRDIDNANIVLAVSRFPPDGGSTKPYELLDGGIPDWLQSQANAQQESIQGTLKYKVGDKWTEVSVSHALTTCDLQSGTRVKVSREGGEAPPTGLAASIWASVGTLWHEGTAELVYDAPTAAWMGRSLTSATGGTGAVQVAEIDLVDGSVSLSFGPPKHITPADFIELCRANRTRVKSTAAGRRASGVTKDGAAEVQVNGVDPRHNSVAVPVNQPPQGMANTVSGLTLPAGTADYQVALWDETGWSGVLASGVKGWVVDVVRATEGE